MNTEDFQALFQSAQPQLYSTLSQQKSSAKDDGRHLIGHGVLELNRTVYGSRYGSGKLFPFLGPHLGNEHIHLHADSNRKILCQTIYPP